MTPFLQDADFTIAENGCWLWQGYVNADGYGRVNRGPATEPPKLAHRYIYEKVVGEIPAGFEIHHACRVSRCVNPAHMLVVTPQEHKRIEQSERTHCRRGHSYAEHGRFHRGKTARYCRACERENARRRAAVR